MKCNVELIEISKEISSQNYPWILSQGICEYWFHKGKYFQGKEWVPWRWKQLPAFSTFSELASPLNCNLLIYTMIMCIYRSWLLHRICFPFFSIPSNIYHSSIVSFSLGYNLFVAMTIIFVWICTASLSSL